jgi:WD40 repeat protein
VATGRKKGVQHGHTKCVCALSFSPDGRLLASGDLGKTAKIWDAATGQEMAALRGHKEYVYGLCFSPNGKLLATAGSENIIKLWDTSKLVDRKARH